MMTGGRVLLIFTELVTFVFTVNITIKQQIALIFQHITVLLLLKKAQVHFVLILRQEMFVKIGVTTITAAGKVVMVLL